ncbi:TIGR03084 family metal-binding protein [Rhodococcus sp. SGAir0479]|uniref:TIGR03084 family metal-binding protein n=1 Tax=Rhodococcus sp. SGAir0479 TaxID=2567884 RepID=UPI0010CCF24B|nr:TIGR03084 family metal-binding protein [Rhodococcus sp. SGAir0479]QCQ92250.1 TIGR03084 family protein [Rhodococcus sp. SGAir0479]
MADLDKIVDDLRAEGAAVDALVADLPDERWAAPTPAAGWTVAHQIGHLAWTDRAALLAATDADGFAAQLTEAWKNPHGFVDEGAEAEARRSPRELLDDWRATRAELAAVLREVPAGRKLPWYGPPMSAASMATARLMETWAHGRDVADALGVRLPFAPRLEHIARLGVRTRDFAYSVNQLTPPTEEFRVELTAPDGAVWAWGPPDAPQRVTGPAEDFCLLVTQRVHRGDTALCAQGPDADRWLDIAQAFAGPPGTGRTENRTETAR